MELKTRRRALLEYLCATAVTPSVLIAQQGDGMYGLIVKIKTAAGRRDEMIALLKESAAGMSGCISYVVAKDAADEDTLWVTEVWDSAESHEASLSLPAVKSAVPRARPMVSAFERVAVTQPVWNGGAR